MEQRPTLHLGVVGIEKGDLGLLRLRSPTLLIRNSNVKMWMIPQSEFKLPGYMHF